MTASHFPFSVRSFKARPGFTLPEILVALAVIGLLGALLFPVFGRARENGRRGHCAGNLQNIYVATRQYREDFQGYPPTLETLLPAGSLVVATSGGHEPSKTGGEQANLEDKPNVSESAGENSLNEGGTHVLASLSYIKSLDEVVCPSDKIQLNAFSSSYGLKNGSVWNFYGYDRFGFLPLFKPVSRLLVNPSQPYDVHRNPAKYSLANRFAPPGTIISHCIFHRTASSKLQDPYALGTEADAGLGGGALDIVLRLDGSAKARDVSAFKGTSPEGSDNNWQIQTF